MPSMNEGWEYRKRVFQAKLGTTLAGSLFKKKRNLKDRFFVGLIERMMGKGNDAGPSFMDEEYGDGSWED